MSNRYQDKTAIVTGAGSGIGRAIAERLSAEGGSVAVLDVDETGGRETVSMIEAAGGHADFHRCDVTDGKEVQAVFGAVAEAGGGLDVLINNAGVACIGTVEQTTEADFDRIVQVNVKGVYHGLKAAVGLMAGRGGAILNMASVASVLGIPDRFAYSMSKGAVYMMTMSVACDYVKQKIRCNCVAPGRIHTPFVDGYLADNYPGREKEMFDRLSATQPVGRMGRPEEVASLVAFLCSDEAAFITGACYPIDGGFINLKT
ncbi:MAG: SDR family oxidoreductase [Phycisphaeraceae bacterium]|nr:SDR family oxidoreductase [Phycisphaeraceae bacterium]